MGTFFLSKNPVKANVGPDLLYPLDVLSSLNTQALAIQDGDPVVGTTVELSTLMQRKLTQADITASYQDGSAHTVGILGLAPERVSTGALGVYTSLVSPVSVFANTPNIYPVPTMAAYEPNDPTTGRVAAGIYSCLNVFGGDLWETTAVTRALIGTQVGILISTISGQSPTFFWSTAAAVKIAKIVQVPDSTTPLFGQTATANVQDTTHYPRCPVFVEVLAAYNQATNSYPYVD